VQCIRWRWQQGYAGQPTPPVSQAETWRRRPAASRRRRGLRPGQGHPNDHLNPANSMTHARWPEELRRPVTAVHGGAVARVVAGQPFLAKRWSREGCSSTGEPRRARYMQRKKRRWGGEEEPTKQKSPACSAMLRRAMPVEGGLTTGSLCEHGLREGEAELGGRWWHRWCTVVARTGNADERACRQWRRRVARLALLRQWSETGRSGVSGEAERGVGRLEGARRGHRAARCRRRRRMAATGRAAPATVGCGVQAREEASARVRAGQLRLVGRKRSARPVKQRSFFFSK
jgi:hypothetical protein